MQSIGMEIFNVTIGALDVYNIDIVMCFILVIGAKLLPII